jgi:hypoxanthine phosphoribosyltransferase
MAQDWIEIDADSIPFKLNHFNIPRHYEEDLDSILLPHGVILDRFDWIGFIYL